MVKRINTIRRVNLFELGSLLSPLCSSGMKSMCHSTYGLTVIVGAALFGGEWHFPWCNYTHRNTRHVNMSCVTRSGLLHCHCGGTLVFLSKTHPHLYVIDLNTLVIHFFSHNPEKKNILPSDLLPIHFLFLPSFNWKNSCFTISVVSCDQSKMSLYMKNQTKPWQNKSKRRKWKFTSYGFCCSALIS